MNPKLSAADEDFLEGFCEGIYHLLLNGSDRTRLLWEQFAYRIGYEEDSMMSDDGLPLCENCYEQN